MSDYVVSGQTYTFPDTYSDEQAKDILVRHGVIKLQGGGGVPPGSAKPPTPLMSTSAAGEVLPAVRSFAAGSLKGIAGLPSAIAGMTPHTETLPPIPSSVQPWHPSTYGAYQSPNPQTGAQQGIAAFQQDPAGTLGQMVPLAAMGANAGIPATGEPPPPITKTGGLPELGTVGKLASHIPGIGKFISAYDIVRGWLPKEPEVTPFPAGKGTGTKYGGPAKTNYTSPNPMPVRRGSGGAAPPTAATPSSSPTQTIPSVGETSGPTLSPEHQSIADEIVKTSRFTTMPKPDFMTKVKDAIQASGAGKMTSEEMQNMYDHIDSRVVARNSNR